MSIFEYCPNYRFKDITLTKTTEEHAEELLRCYSDARVIALFNSDNCTTNFECKTIEQMKSLIAYWEKSYDEGTFVRLSVVLNDTYEIIGTVEMYRREENDNFNGYGMLRIDLRSDYEDYDIISQILQIVDRYFYDEFEVAHILTKAPESADDRISALNDADFCPLKQLVTDKYGDYYVK